MRIIYILYCLLLLPFVSWTQDVMVVDKESDEPLEMVAVACGTPKFSEYTDENGLIDISSLKSAQNVVFQFAGYVSYICSYDSLIKIGFEVRLEPTLGLLPHTVVASKWSEDGEDHPNTVVKISSRSMELANPQTAADMLAESGEVYVQKSQQGGGSPMIRGFSANRLLYSVDGIRMNTAIFRSGNLQNVISLDPLSLENTEVVFGPGSVIYGSDAIGGVMGFQTLKPRLSVDSTLHVSGNVFGRTSSANLERTGHFDLNLGKRKFASVTSASYSVYDHLKMGSQGPDDYLRIYTVERINGVDSIIQNSDSRIQNPTGYSQINLMQKFRFKPSNSLELNYGFHYSETTEYGRYDRHLRTKNDLPRYAEWNYGPQKWMMNQFKVSKKSDTKLFDDVTMNAAWQKFEESRITRDFQDSIRETRTENVDAFSINLDFYKKISKTQRLLYGVEYVQNNVKSIGEIQNLASGDINLGPSRYPNSIWRTHAIYLSDQIHVHDKVTLDLGVRYSIFDIHSEFDTSFYPLPFFEANLTKGGVSGSAGVIYKINSSSILRANFANGFRAPNVDDFGKIFDSAPGVVVVPNPNLKSEVAYNIDLSYAKIFKNICRLELTGFYTLLKDAMVRRDYMLNGEDSIVYDGEMSKVEAVQNAAQAEVYGVQGSLEFKFKRGFGLKTQYNYQKGTEELSNGETSRSRHAAPSFGRTSITYKYKKLNLNIYTDYNAEISFIELPENEKVKTELYALDQDGNPYSPSWYTLNLKVKYSPIHNLILSGGVENILDQRYRPYSSGLTATGRNFILSAKFRF